MKTCVFSEPKIRIQNLKEVERNPVERNLIECIYSNIDTFSTLRNKLISEDYKRGGICNDEEECQKDLEQFFSRYKKNALSFMLFDTKEEINPDEKINPENIIPYMTFSIFEEKYPFSDYMPKKSIAQLLKNIQKEDIKEYYLKNGELLPEFIEIGKFATDQMAVNGHWKLGIETLMKLSKEYILYRHSNPFSEPISHLVVSSNKKNSQFYSRMLKMQTLEDTFCRPPALNGRDAVFSCTNLDEYLDNCDKSKLYNSKLTTGSPNYAFKVFN